MTPKFVKKYVNLAEQTLKALGDYLQDVKASRFPEEQHTYKMLDGEEEKLNQLAGKIKT